MTTAPGQHIIDSTVQQEEAKDEHFEILRKLKERHRTLSRSYRGRLGVVGTTGPRDQAIKCRFCPEAKLRKWEDSKRAADLVPRPMWGLQ
jgi:hypothetical protein